MWANRKRFAVLGYYYLFLVALAVVVAVGVPLRWSVVEAGMVEPARRTIVKADVAGVISEVLAEDGARVERGQPILRIYDPQVAAAIAVDQAEFDRARLQLEYARKMRKRGYIPQAELENAEIAYKVGVAKLKLSQSYEIRSPIDGTLLTTDEFALREGDMVEPGNVLATVADISRMRLKVRIHEHNISKVQVGNEVRIYMNAYPSMLFRTLQGRVARIFPQAQDGQTGVGFVALIDIFPPIHAPTLEERLLPGMVGQAKIVYDRSSFFHHVVVRSLGTLST